MYKLSFIILTFIPLYMFAQAPKKSKTLSIHGHDRIDEYYWMNERDSKAVLENLQQENEYASNYFKPLQPLINSLLTEFEQRINPNEVSAPFILNNRKYQVKNSSGKDYQQIILIEKNKEVIFFDENERAKDADYYDLGDWSPSPNNQLLAVSEDYVGRRKYSITFRENKSGNYLSDKIEETSGGVVWANDNKRSSNLA
jgi:oligopeptidase B